MTHDLRLLTFDRYETYLRPVTRARHHWDVAVAGPHHRLEPWQAARRYSDRTRLVSPGDARKRLDRGDYDAVVCHGPQDLAAVADAGIPTITVFHGTLELEAACGFDWPAFRRQFEPALEQSRRVFVSHGLRESWGLTGEVIAPAIDPLTYAPYEGDLPTVLAVSDFEAARVLMSGGTSLERALAGLPVALAGINPPQSLQRSSGELMRHAYRRHQVFVHLTQMPYDTGCPLALVDAMAAGMPIVTVAGPATPVVDGVSALVAETAAGVRERCLALLEQREFAGALGRAAREAATALFAPARYLNQWEAVLDSLVHRRGHDAARTERHAASR